MRWHQWEEWENQKNLKQSAYTLRGDIEICFIWIPIVLCVLIAVLTYFYKLDSIRGEMTEELEKRR